MKERLDRLLVALNLVPSREKGRDLILNGRVCVNGIPVKKPSFPVGEEDRENIEIRREGPEYVSRGGLKLKKAIDCFGIDLSGLVCMDIGASTGGFTDCMLREGAARVYAIDVGRGQLDRSLACDERVLSMEQTNIRYLKPTDLGETMDFISIDVSFISLSLVFPPVIDLLKEDGSLVCLIKPQFEAGPDKLSKKGVVKSSRARERAIEKVMAAAIESGFCPQALTWSPIRGHAGNMEYLLFLRKKGARFGMIGREEIHKLVKKSCEDL